MAQDTEGGAVKSDLKVDAFLRNVPLFKDVSSEEIEHIAQATKVVHAARGHTLFHKGDAVNGFHILVYGQVKLGFTSPSGSDKVVEIVGPGMSFGEALMFLEKPAVVYAQAIADSMLLFVSRQAVFDELDRHPAFGRRMLGGLSRRLHGLVMDVESYSLYSGAQRVIGYLLRSEGEWEAGQEPREVMLDASKNIIASRLNLTPQHFSRILHELTVANLIEVDGRTIRILDVERLRHFEM
ncbi:MAG: Crp/Fnr family transcriptional regulator [Burkholderiales bacterium]